MPVSFPLPTLKGTTQTNLISYATNPPDHPHLEKLSALIPRLSQDELAGLAIAALNEGFEPSSMFVDYAIEVTHSFERCVELLQNLSLPGKVALVRCLAELLAISLGIASISSTPTSPSLPPVPAPHPENAWGLLSLEDAIAFAKAGHMDPALLVWEFSPQSYSVIPPELLAVANKNLPRLMAVLKTTPS